MNLIEGQRSFRIGEEASLSKTISGSDIEVFVEIGSSIAVCPGESLIAGVRVTQCDPRTGRVSLQMTVVNQDGLR